MSSSPHFQIAIDGPVAAGKGTTARLVANRLDFLYVDTGAMYRMTAYLGLQAEADLQDQEQVAKLIHRANMEMRNPLEEEKDGRLTTVILNGEDVSWKIRTEEVGRGASIVSQFPVVRKALVKQQQQIATTQSVVMEGRDITSVVLPSADLKIYLTANDVVRAKRRFLELQTRGFDTNFEEVFKDLIERDRRDMERDTDPLKIADDAWVVDTSDLSIEQVVNAIVARVNVLQEKL